MEKKSITSKPVAYQTPVQNVVPQAYWRPDDFRKLIDGQGYDAYIDRALRCPCVDKATGQASSSCRNCIGRGWFFVDRKETRIISQTMKNIKKYENWSEVNRGTASITTKGVDKLGFMDRIILIELEAWYSEILKPIEFEGELIAYPVYEPLEISNIFLFVGDATKLIPIPDVMYKIEQNAIVFDQSIIDQVSVNDVNEKTPTISISIRYSYYPVYHVLEANRELMKVRTRTCSFSEEDLTDMPINVTARKAHWIFDAQKYGNNLFDNTVQP